MTIIAYIILGIYTIALTYITTYCLLQFQLLYAYKGFWRKNKSIPLPAVAKKANAQPALVGADAGEEVEGEGEYDWPIVTVQLPIYNELYVIARLIDRVCEFDYPKDKLEIHILDDSTDETVQIVADKVAEWKAKGFNIEQIRRVDRVGFKAGALKEGMKVATGDFMAIFDADFMPRLDFLKNTIPHFQNEKIGVVQTRWEHINENYSLLTRLQALQLNVHFTVEQMGRKAGNYLLQFNGTAGIWRRQTIDEAGGWEADTLTEDLDLSIRAQLKGWEILYLEKFGSPAELPAEMNGLKSQQHRWMKGGAETAKKMLPTVWSSNLSFGQKIQATSHLLGSTVFVFIFLVGVFSVPLVFLLDQIYFNANAFAWFLVGLLSITSIYFVGNVQSDISGASAFKLFFKVLFLFPLFLALSMGLSLHNTVAVLQGYIGKKSPFVRTPKYAINTIKDSFQKDKYRSFKLEWTTIGEGLLTLYFICGVVGGVYLQEYTFLVFHTLLTIGYGTIFFYTLKHLSLK